MSQTLRTVRRKRTVKSRGHRRQEQKTGRKEPRTCGPRDLSHPHG